MPNPSPPEVLIVQRRLTEYRVGLFERLRTELAARGIRLTVLHGTPTHDEEARRDEGVLPWAVRTRSRYSRVLGKLLSWTHIPRVIRRAQDLVIVTHENGILANYCVFFGAKLRRKKVAWWGHGPKVLGPQISVAERAKRSTARWGVRYFAYTEESVRRVRAAGVPPARITCLDNAVECEASGKDGAWEADRATLKEQLGIGDAPVAVYLGSLSHAKRIPTLLAAGDALAGRIPGFRLLVIGDGPLRALVQGAAADRPWLTPLGARHGRDKALACSLGRVMLNPGMVGLNIVDAFAMGLPLITMRHDLHSPEIAYLENGRNGLMSEDELGAFVEASFRALTDSRFHDELVTGCREAAERYTIERMTRNFADGIEIALDGASRAEQARERLPQHTVAVVLRTFLPYHLARLRRLREVLRTKGVELVEIEVASTDAAYGFGSSGPDSHGHRHCCFPGTDYQSLSSRVIHGEVLRTLERVRPDAVICHATPFPEGMAAISYRNRTAARVYVVDDAWAVTDRSGPIVRQVKRVIHRSVDGAILSSQAHANHYATLGVPEERSVTGWSVVDNDRYAAAAREARLDPEAVRGRLKLPPRYFLFVGRFLARKGIADLLHAYGQYRARVDNAWPLVLVGGSRADLTGGERVPADIQFAGRLFGEDLAGAMALAGALVVPSLLEQWGLVINEAMAAGTPVIATRACGGAQMIRDGASGWLYDAGNTAALAELLGRISSLPDQARSEIGMAAQRDVSRWGLDRFADAVLRALELPRRMAPGWTSRAAVRLWNGRVRAY